MKKFVINGLMIISLLILASSTSCVSSLSQIPIKGSGDVVDRSYDLKDFNGVDVSSGFDVILVQGNEEKVIISAQQNIFEYIHAQVEAGVLKIYIDRNVTQTKGLKAKIYLKSINSLDVSGGGDVLAENTLNVPNLKIDLSGGGDIKTDLKTGDLDCGISGGGDATISGDIAKYNLSLSGGGDINSDIASETVTCSVSGGGDVAIKNQKKASQVEVGISGGGDISLNVEADAVKCSVSGGGDATLAGKGGTLEISINGGGDVNAGSFKTEKASFHANGGSDIRVNASAEIAGTISGGGNVYYSGGAGIVNIDAKGGSTVHKE
jgi:hypothetical protein